MTELHLALEQKKKIVKLNLKAGNLHRNESFMYFLKDLMPSIFAGIT